MAHHSLKSGYHDLVERLNRFPQGAPPSETLHRILALLFSEREASLVAALPIRPFTARRAARLWKTTETEARKMLDALAGRAILLDMDGPDGATTYVLPPPMAGFFEFSLMRTRGDLDQKLLAELFHQYLNVEEAFVRDLFTGTEAPLGRFFVHEPALPADGSLVVLDHERATEVIRTASCIGVGMCYCRHKMAHLGGACDAPMDICMTFNTCAQSLTRHGAARAIEARECLDLLQAAQDRLLVQFGDNVRQGVGFICNCCGCCCEALTAVRRFGLTRSLSTTGFMPVVDPGPVCNGCGRCARACPVEAMALVSAHDPSRPGLVRARLEEDRCLGCGVCVRACPSAALRLEPRASRVLTPVDTTHRAVLMAIEKGQLQNLLFDQHALLSHRAMAAVLGVILRLPPLKQVLASRQMKSRYLERLLARAQGAAVAD